MKKSAQKQDKTHITSPTSLGEEKQRTPFIGGAQSNPAFFSSSPKKEDTVASSKEVQQYELRPGEIEYGHYLMEAFQILNEAREIHGDDFFGRIAEGGCEGMTPIVKKRYYDLNFWHHEVDCNEVEVELVANAPVLPSHAIDELFNRLKEKIWRFDCAEYLQVADWYAMRHSMGEKKFNETMPMPMILRPHGSSGIKSKRLYRRNSPTDQFYVEDFNTKQSKPTRYTVHELLAKAPVGSRVTWTNMDAKDDSAFKNENSRKVNDDLYATHPYGIVTEKQVKELLARDAIENQEQIVTDIDEYILKNVYLSQIEIFEL